MEWREKALMGITVAAGLLCLTMAPTWSMAFVILLGMIRLAAGGKMMRRNQASAADDTARAHEQAPAADDTARAHEQAPAADDTARAHEQAPAADDTARAHDAHVLDIDKLLTLVCCCWKPAVLVSSIGQESSSTSSSSPRFKYDLFLNFRGSDIGYGFVDDLFSQLNDAGIRVFNDKCDPTPGKESWPEFKGAIKQSRISIAIFSKGFASSIFCLKGLVEMWECRKTNEQTIIPIFYDVSPTEVRDSTRGYGEALVHYESKGRVDSNTIETWREVLREIGTLNGFTWESHNGAEGKLVKKVVAGVMQLLEQDYPYVDDKLVGNEHHAQEMMRKLGVAYSEGRAIEVQGEEVRVVAICGVQGVGKTTLAKAVFYKMRKLFDAHSFLKDIRLEEVQISRRCLIADLKKQIPKPHESSSEETEAIASLCHDAKVLIVLDGVDKEEQIKALAGKLTWFGPGSRIIVTTNKNDVLKAFDVGAVEKHTVRPLDNRLAHKLFCKHAFQGDAAQDVSEYFNLSLKIAKAIGGLPSDIVRQASSLREDMDMVRWVRTAYLLQKNRPKKGIRPAYRKSVTQEDQSLRIPLRQSTQDSSIDQSPVVS